VGDFFRVLLEEGIMKYHYLFEESIKSEDQYYCGAYLTARANTQPVDFIHSSDLEAIFTFIRKMEGKV
jgi:hypothetical protein